ncbi:MAG: hypothetical protein ABSD78_15940 [Acidimicrobiales bacterium]
MLSAFQNFGNPDCSGIVDLSQPVAGTVLGISKSVDTYFFVLRITSSSDCNAAMKSVSALSMTGFPSG